MYERADFLHRPSGRKVVAHRMADGIWLVEWGVRGGTFWATLAPDADQAIASVQAYIDRERKGELA